MPPKGKGLKKEEELTDLTSLPKAYPILIRLLFNFNSFENYKALESVLTDKAALPPQPKKPPYKIQTVSLEDVIECGTRKDLFSEENTEEGDRKPDELSKAFACRVYEILAETMKEKGDRYAAIKEQQIAQYMASHSPKPEDSAAPTPVPGQKGKAPPPPKKGIKKEESTPQLDIPIKYPQNQTDLFLFLNDFPHSKAEIEEISGEKYAVTITIVINEIESKEAIQQKLDEEEDRSQEEEQPEKTEEEVKKAENEAEFLEKAKTKNGEFIENLLELQSIADRESPLRFCIIKQMNYSHFIEKIPENEEERPQDISTSDLGEPAYVNSLKEFKQDLYEELNSIGSGLIKYHTFRSQVNLLPLTKPSPNESHFVEELKIIAEESAPEEKIETKATPKPGAKETIKSSAKDMKTMEQIMKYDTAAVYPFTEKLAFPKSTEITSLMFPFFFHKNITSLTQEAQDIGPIFVSILQHIVRQNEEHVQASESDSDKLSQLFSEMKQNINIDYDREQRKKPEYSGPKIERELKCPYQIIFDSVDEVRIRNFSESLLDKSVNVGEKELDILNNLILPGKNRHMMPETAAKSEALREAQKTEMYPFSSLSISQFERQLMLQTMEQMLEKDNAQQEWNFGNRIFEEKYNPQTLWQALSQMMVLEPDIASKYYSRDDSLLLSLYFKNPPGRLLRKKWALPFLHIADFQNWREHIMKEDQEDLDKSASHHDKSLTKEQKDQIAQVEKEKGEKAEVVQALDIDDYKIGHMTQRVKLMYPSDDSVIRVSYLNIKKTVLPTVRVIKDAYIFGVRPNKGVLPAATSQEGEFWLQFQNGTKFLAQMEKQVIEDEDFQNALTGIMTFKSGLIVKFLSSGDILQLKSESLAVGDDELDAQQQNLNTTINQERAQRKNLEYQRVFTGKGSVIRYLRNGVIEVLYANGNYSEYKNGLWVTTNNKGLRNGRKVADNYVFDMDKIACAHKTDPETLAKVMIRDDNVITIRYKDNTILTKHKDGTQMRTSKNGDCVVIESKGFAPVRLTFDKVKARTGTAISRGGTDALVGVDDIMIRSCNGRVAETFLPDDTIVQTYREKQELDMLDEFSYATIHLVKTADGGVVKLKQDGEIVLITPQERQRLNLKGQDKPFGQDVDYFYELFGVPTERKSGVYSCACDLGKLWTIDDEGNRFIVFANGDTREKIAVSLDLDNIEDLENYKPESPRDFEGSTYIDENYRFLPPPKTVMEPLLFQIKNDGTGSQFFSPEQMNHYFQCHFQDKHTTGGDGEGHDENLEEKHHTFIKKFTKEAEKKQTLLEDVELPRTVEDIQQTVIVPEKPNIEVFTYRNLLEHPPMDEERRSKFLKDLERFDTWKQLQNKQQTEFGIVDPRKDEEKLEEKKIQTLIYQERKVKREDETDEEVKDRRLQERFKDSDMVDSDNLQGTEYGSLQENSRGSRIFKERAVPLHKQKTQSIDKDLPIKIDGPKDPRAHPHQLRAVKDVKKSINQSMVSQTISQLTNVGGFVPNYFLTRDGIKFADDHPALPPDPEVLQRMEDRLRASQIMTPSEQHNLESARKDGYSPDHPEGQDPPEIKSRTSDESGKNNPIVALEPEEDKKKREEQKKKLLKSIKAPDESHYIQQQKFVSDLERHKMLLGEEYHVSKTKDFNVYGKPREDVMRPLVKSIKRTTVGVELNENYISIDSITDRRIKTCSMAIRSYIKAPPVQTIRAQGQHQMISNALTKKQTFEELMLQNNAMIEYALSDPLKRNLLIVPAVARFGSVKVGKSYEILLQCKNEDCVPQRLKLRNPSQTKNCNVRIVNPGPIAPGMSAKVAVTIKTSPEKIGKIQEEFHIVTKTEIFKIPVFANILNKGDYDELERESYRLHNRPLRKPNVKELGVKRSILPWKNEQQHVKIDETQKTGSDGEEEFDETTMTDAKLPGLPQHIATPPFDPSQSIGQYKKAQGGDRDDSYDNSGY